MINILSAVTVWYVIFMYPLNPMGAGEGAEEFAFILGAFLLLPICVGFIFDFEEFILELIKAWIVFWLGVFTGLIYGDWFDFMEDRILLQLIFGYLTSYIWVDLIDYKSLFLKLINTGSQFFNKNYKKFKKSQSANNFQPIEFKKLTKLYTHPKQIKWLVMLGILLIVLEVGFLIIFGDNYFTIFLLILLGIAFVYSFQILQSLEESQLDFTTKNFQHFFSTWMSNILYYFTLLLDKIPDIPDSKVQDKKPQKTSKSKIVKAKEFDKYEHMGFFERVKARMNDESDKKIDEMMKHGTPSQRHSNAKTAAFVCRQEGMDGFSFEKKEIQQKLKEVLVLSIKSEPYYERKYALKDINGDSYSFYAFLYPEVFDKAFKNGNAVMRKWTFKKTDDEFVGADSFVETWSEVPYSTFNSQKKKIKIKESDRLFKKMNKAEGEAEKEVLEVLYIKAVESECNEEIEVLNQKISKARTEKSKENYRKKIAQLKSKITKAFQLKVTEEKLNEWGLVDMGDGNYGDGETITHVIEGFGLRRVAKSKQNLSPNIDEPKSASIEDELKKLKSLLDQGLITKKQYEDKTNKLLGL